MGLQFKYLPSSNLRAPGIYVEDQANPNASGDTPEVALLIGNVLTGSALAAAGQVGVPQVFTTETDIVSRAGAGSILARMVQQYLQIDQLGQLYILPIADDPGATAATGSVAFAGTATAQGVLSLYIAGELASVPVAVGTTAAQLATLAVATVNAIADMPVTAAVDGTNAYQVDLTSKSKAFAANDIDIRINYMGIANGEATPAGITVTIVPMASGTINPSLTVPLGNLLTQPFDFIAHPYTDATSLTAFDTFMAESSPTGRWNWSQKLFGHIFTAYRSTYAGQVTLGTARNGAHQTIMGFYDSPTTNWEWAAAIAALAAVSVRANPAKAILGELTGIKAPPIASQFPKFPNRNTLLFDGISTFKVARDGTVSVEKLITTYQTNSAGQADSTFLDVESLYQTMYALRAMIASRTQFEGLVINNTAGYKPPAGSNVVTPPMIQASDVAAYSALEQEGVVQDTAAFAAATFNQPNASNPDRIDGLWPIILTNRIDVQALLAQISNVAI